MRKIFVSYTNKDKNINIDFLYKVQQFLKAYGDSYIDLFDNKSLSPQFEILKRINECDLLLVIKPSENIESKWVCMEIKLAEILGKKVVYVESSFFFQRQEEILKKIKI